MRFEIFLVGINVAPRGVVHPQGLQGADGDDRLLLEILRPQLLAIGNIEHAQAIDAETAFQRLALATCRA